MSNKIYFGEKVLIDCLRNGNKVKQLNIMLPKTSAYVKIYDGQAKWMYLLIEFDDVIEKYNTIWDKASADIKNKKKKKKGIDSEPVYTKNYLKNKIKSLDDEITDFHDKKKI